MGRSRPGTQSGEEEANPGRRSGAATRRVTHAQRSWPSWDRPQEAALWGLPWGGLAKPGGHSGP